MIPQMSAGPGMAGQLARQPVAHEITARAASLADIADEVYSRARERLSPICVVSVPQCEPDTCGVSREYPPFFDDLRDKLIRIEEALNGINDVLDRAEI